jgi:signal transduction histidine kinase
VTRTLRTRLLVHTAAATALVMLAAGLAVIFFTRSSLLAEFDRSLLSAARAIQLATEQGAGGVSVDVAGAQFPEYARKDSPEYFEAWLDDGTQIARSVSLASGSGLGRQVAGGGAPVYAFVTLPDGRPGRRIEMRFVPAREDEEKPADRVSHNRSVTLAVAHHTDVLDARLSSLRWLLIFVGLAATAATAATLHVAVTHGLRPLKDLGGRISGIGQGNLGERIELPQTPAELAVVVDRLNDLLFRLHHAMSRERAFTSEVAHELRTPLAGLEVTLEVAASRQRAPADYEARIGKSLMIVRDMRSMVENLLTLARADAGQLAVNRCAIELESLVEECWNRFAQDAESRHLKASIEIGQIRLESDRDKLRIVLQNLMDNAVCYCPEGGQIGIAAREDGGWMELSIRNSATIDPAQLPHVFDRFWRGDGARSDPAVHCGLGLPLCQKIVRLLDGSIAVQAPDRNTFEVLVRLPATVTNRPAPPKAEIYAEDESVPG